MPLTTGSTPGRHVRWLESALKLARANPNTKHKHAAIFVHAGSVQAYGINSERAAFYPSRHAEWAAVREHLDVRGTLYVARATKAGQPSNSAPCSLCLETLLHYTQVKAVYFTVSSNLTDSFDLASMRRSNAKVHCRR